MATTEMRLAVSPQPEATPSSQAPPDTLVFPASRAQQRFWLLDQFKPGNPGLNVAVRFALRGPVNPQLVTRAFNQIVERHEILRTSFAMVEGQTVQIVAPSVAIGIPYYDLRALAQAERNAEADRLASEEACAPFDLTCSPLLRAGLIRIADSEHILLVTVHHIVADGWSIGIIADELAAFYEALAAHRQPSLAELPIQYADYTLWQKERLESAELAPSLEFWQQQVRDLPHFEVPGDLPRSANPEFRGHIVSRLLPRELTSGLRDLAHEHGATMYMTALAAFFLLLHRYTGESEMVVGSQVVGRNLPELEPLIGVFINTVILRAAADGKTTFAELLDRVAEQVTQVLAHQEVPFDQIAEFSNEKRSADRNVLFQVNFIYQRDFVKPLDFAGIRMTPIPSVSPGAVYDLNVFMVERAEGWRLSCEYNTDLYSAPAVAAMLRHLESVLAAVQRDPNRCLSEYELMEASERNRIVSEWNRTGQEYPADLPLSRLIEAQVRETPDRCAVIFGTRRLTYAELDAAANRFAHYLRSRGVKRGELVGVCVDRSEQMLIAVLGVSKAGGVYVPLDPHFPRERLEFMVRDSAMETIVVQTNTSDLFETGARHIVMDREASAIAAHPETAPDEAAGPEDLAYILYTSGSTGKPKGVQIPHRALVNLLCSMRREPGIDAGDVLLAVTTLSFDIAELELFLPLISGACVVIASSHQAADAVQLRKLMAASGATMMQATPVTWRMLIEAGWKGSSGLKVLCGGEPLKRQLADELLSRCGQLWNVYGPTETTVWSSASRIESNGQPITIGRPIANTFFYVLDEQGRPVPAGVQGELYIGGDGVARGYRNRPELTRERFVPDPFQRIEGARMYRTGDRARWRMDGTVELFGRIDTQVKVRGFRIELGEIEATMARSPLIQESAVVVREDASGEPALAGYFVPVGRTSDSAEQVRRFLAQALPDYMVPSHLVALERMPLTPNGKIDRSALPAPNTVPGRAAAEAFEGASDELEAKLIRIWETVLNVRPVSRNANFFDLGGRSVLAARMFAQVEKTLGKALPLASLFQAPTVAQLAMVLRDAGWTPPWACLVPIRPAGFKPPFFFVHPIGGNVVSFHGFAERFDADQPVYGLQARGLDGKEAPYTRIEDMAAHYVACIRSVQPEGPYHIGGFSAGGLVAFEMARCLDAAGERVEVLALLDTPIDAPAPSGFGARMVHRLGRWQRTVTFNARYIFHTGVGRFTAQKLKNWRMRARIRAWQARNRDQSGVLQPGALNVEEAFLVAVRQYTPKFYRGSLTLFRAKDELVRNPDPMLGWGQFAEGGVNIRETSGDHDTVLDEPHIGELALDLNLCLKDAYRRERGDTTDRFGGQAPAPHGTPRSTGLEPLGQSA